MFGPPPLHRTNGTQMTNEERDLITRFIQRVGGAPAAGGFAGGSVPATTQAMPLPPIDREADTLLADLFARYPEARYRITQLAFVQEHALSEAQNRINALQFQIQQLQQAEAAQPAPTSSPPASSPWGNAGQPAPQPAPSRGMFGGLFGSGQPQQPQYAPPPPPQPQYAPGYQPGMFQQRGSGFLGSALTTAAGVAGGMVAGNALMHLFSGGGQAAASQAASLSPWGASPAADPFALGGAPKDAGWSNAPADSGWVDSSVPAQPDQGWVDSTPSTDAGWTDAASDSSGGWSDSDPDNS